ncbi:MAG: (2Fe-2S)-binding protein [Chloroflexi bacterium]|nr:(2Fe-2S)-binding protein [Chloroflexota bacterium]MBV9894035.1 (2Fe-2S)-binding protein [Chloroflexota bacterium]
MVTTPGVETVKLTIDGVEVEAPKGMLLIEAAKLVGFEIPVFCYEERLKPVGACRMCLVQIEKLPRLQTACTTPVAADMVVHTITDDVKGAQNGVLELLLANHPLDCPICDKGGECPLQDNTFRHGPGASRFTEEKRHKEKAYPLGPQIVLDRERCIMCYRCVRFHQEIPGDEALAAVQRGADSEIATLNGEPYTSIYAGNTIELCPVGALTSRSYRFKARPWDLVRTPSICSGCAVGCNIEVHSRSETVLRLWSRRNRAVDDGWLCDRGRFETLPTPPECRPMRPMVRRGDALAPATWDEALARAAETLGSSAGVLASQRLSNEAFWILQRLGPRLPGALWPPAGEAWPVDGRIENLQRCKSIVLIGLDAWEDLPVLALWIRRAVLAGAKLTVLGDRNGLWRNTATWLKGDPLAHLSDVQAVEGPVAVLVHPALVAGHRSDLEAFATRLGANGETGLVGAPLLGANGRGALELAPELARGDVDQVLTAKGILAIGDEDWSQLKVGSFGRLVLATSGPVPDSEHIDVVLPMAHAYERQASLINLDGRIQHQEGGAAPPTQARTDWGLAAEIGIRLGMSVPGSDDLEAIRGRMIDEHPHLSEIVREKALIARV